MELIKEIFFALWHKDYKILMSSSFKWIIYVILFIILFLENGIIPAAFLPGDSLLILIGILIAKGTFNYLLTIIILTIGTSLGCWFGYFQGKWLGNHKIIKNWISCIPKHYQQHTYNLFNRYGLAALFIGRFFAFIRTIMPTIAGLSGLSNKRFHFFNWLSGLLWVLVLTTIGYILGKSLFFKYYENQIMNILTLIPIILFFIGLISTILIILKRKFKRN